MSSTASTNVPKRKRPSFDPPRPRAPAKSTNTPKASKVSKSRGRPSNSAKQSSRAPSPSDSTADSPVGSQPASPEPEYMLAEITTDEPRVTIPTKLLVTLLNHHFEHKEKTKIGKDASLVFTNYIDTFVREALARAMYERQEADHDSDSGRGDGFLEVEDLEKLAPQLILDF